MEHKFFFISTLIIVILIVGGYLFLASVIDPFNFFHQITEERYFSKNDRFSKRGLIDKQGYDSFIIGSSLAQIMPVFRLNQSLEAKFAQLSISGLRSYEQLHILKTIPKGNYQYLILEAYFRSNLKSYDDTSSFPYQLYSRGLRYLLGRFKIYCSISSSVLGEMYHALNYNLFGIKQKDFADKKSFSSEGVVSYKSRIWESSKAIKNIREVKKNYSSWNLLELSSDDFEKTMKLASLKFRKVVVFFPPISAVSLKEQLIYKDPQNIENYLQWKNTIAEISIQYSNVMLVDYQTLNEITTKYSNYYDYNHYRESVMDLLEEDFISILKSDSLQHKNFGHLIKKEEILLNFSVKNLKNFDEKYFYDYKTVMNLEEKSE